MRARRGAGAALVLACLLAVHVPVRGQGIQDLRSTGLQVPPQALLDRLRSSEDPSEAPSGWMARTALAMETSEPLTGTMPVAIILALFADSPEPHVTPQAVQQAMFDGPSPYGTVSEFYAEASGGRFAVTGRTTPWVRTSLPMAQVVGSEYGLGRDARTGEYLLEALAAADTLLDFTRFDNDGPDGIPDSGDDDGVADAVAFQFLEIGASCGGPAIWPHRASIEFWTGREPYVTDDVGAGGAPIIVSDYTTQGATDCGGVVVQKATTIAHELGHVLGLPDLYDRSLGLEPEHRRWVVGCWSLMAAGSWGCGVGDREGWVRPTHLSAWEKEQLGWLPGLEVVEPVLGTSFALPPVRTSGQALKIPLEPDLPEEYGEYLLVEYRTREGFDADLPASGVMIYHVDPEVGGNQPCQGCSQVYRVGVLEADGNQSLRRTILQGGNRGEAGDAWGASGPGTLANGTSPSTRLNSGERSPVTFYRISLEEGVAHLVLSSRAIPGGTLLQSFLESGEEPLTEGERAYLDDHGNANGRFDVGDLRAYLRR